MKNIEFYRKQLSKKTKMDTMCKTCVLMRTGNITEYNERDKCHFEQPCPNDKEIIDFLLKEHTKPVELTNFEKIILECVDGYFNYITRDKDERLFLYETRPQKNEYGVWEEAGNMTCKLFPFTNMFKFIHWEDDDPYFIIDLLERGQK